jgi:hypothetical protein
MRALMTSVLAEPPGELTAEQRAAAAAGSERESEPGPRR